MVIGTQITDGSGTKRKAHLHKRNGDTGLKVFTEPLYEFDANSTPAFNPDLGVQMAVDASFGGTPDGVHNGTDSVLWTGSQISGTKTTFDSTAQANSGTKSIQTNNANVGNTFQLARASSIDLSGYVAITMYIYVDSDWSIADSVAMVGYDTGTASIVGNAITLETYFNETTFDVWQKVTIPLEDMLLETSSIDAFRIEQIAKSGKAPLYYIDDFQIEETGQSYAFIIEPDPEEILYVSTLRFTFEDALNTTLASNSMPNLSLNKLLNVSSLDNGINIQRRKDGVIQFSASFSDLSDFLSSGFDIAGLACDGTNTIMALEVNFKAPAKLDSRDKDNITITISDDLSGLTSLKAFSLGASRIT
jgi:hypothetical protein